MINNLYFIPKLLKNVQNKSPKRKNMKLQGATVLLENTKDQTTNIMKMFNRGGCFKKKEPAQSTPRHGSSDSNERRRKLKSTHG